MIYYSSLTPQSLHHLYVDKKSKSTVLFGYLINDYDRGNVPTSWSSSLVTTADHPPCVSTPQTKVREQQGDDVCEIGRHRWTHDGRRSTVEFSVE